jgi:DUF4097 and DUF4098 domain-containing protein YvlB
MKFIKYSIFILLMISTINIFSQQNLKLLVNKTLPTESGKTLNLSTFAGEVIITAWDRNEAEIKISGNETAEKMLIFDVSSVSSGIKIDGQKSKDSDKKNYSLSLKYEIKVPQSYNIDVFTGGGGVSVTGVNGSIKANTSGGNLTVENCSGSINMSTAGGNVTIEKFTGPVDVSTSGGNIKATDFSGNFKASTMGGNITLGGGNGVINAHTAGGSISLDFTGKNEGIELSTMGGNIKLLLPADINADADLSTLVGKITTDFVSTDDSKISAFLKTTFNAGGSKLKCTTQAGNITVIKK